MGDFLLDFRARGARRAQAEALRFFPDMVIDAVERDGFSFFASRVGRDDLWAPYEAPDGVVAALAGRVAMDPVQWDAAVLARGPGGLACKALWQAYRAHGPRALEGFSGAYALFVHDPVLGASFFATDRGGACPAYASPAGDLLCSHPDVLAGALAEAGAAPPWDLTSMAQFLATGVVSWPFSYYRGVSALGFGRVHRFDHTPQGMRPVAPAPAGPPPALLDAAGEEEIAERLAHAVAAAARRCTLPRLGRTAIALSGGLDSRALLCGAEPHPGLFTFCAFDQRNAEFSYASAIAEELGVRLEPFARPFDHYGENAEAGVRITGGMGDFVSNHFLGFRERLRALGVDNLVTGCYFDYLFKSLALDVREAGLLRRERFRDFHFQTYLPHFATGPRHDTALGERLDALYPQADRAPTSEARARLAQRRIFPLYHEGDNAQRLVPLRTMGWFAPSLDAAVLDLCRAIPPKLKLNRRVYLRAVRRVCGEAVSAIPDANTGLPLNASPVTLGINRYRVALRRWVERHSRSMATAESWPNWVHYLRASRRLRELWLRPNPAARELLAELTGEPFHEDPARYADRPIEYFTRQLTLKLWLDQRGA